MSNGKTEALSPSLSDELTAASRERSDERWQRRLLPVMVRMLVGLTVFFFVATLVQLFYLHRAIQTPPQTDVVSLLTSGAGSGDGKLAPQYRAQVLMEANLIERKYHQANVFLMSRVWVHYLGFVTGMILALVGAIFILGKLQTEATELGVKGAGNALDLRSTSPGLVLAVLGVLLMSITIVVHHPIFTTNVAVYMPLGDKPTIEPPPSIAPTP